MARSRRAVASGLPAPLYAETGVVFVTTRSAWKSTRGIRYGPVAISRVPVTMSSFAPG